MIYDNWFFHLGAEGEAAKAEWETQRQMAAEAMVIDSTEQPDE